jgi:mannose-6-phosphate isomerase
MEPLKGRVQNYAWGSRTAMAELFGKPSPTPQPEAELWMGAHPSAPSLLWRNGQWQSLLEVVRARPEIELGSEVAREFGSAFPFLLKILAAEQPLSLQAHPDRVQAERGFAADEALGIARDAPKRRYRDQNHKPELLCALTEFEALCGFRAVPKTLRLFEALGLFGALEVRALTALRRQLENPAEAEALRSALGLLLGLGGAERGELVGRVVEACTSSESPQEFARERAWARRLAQLYPEDAGVIVALMLNLIVLRPGSALYLPPRSLHAYLGGLGVEIMASSDNVLRGGLTPKHVDVPELLQVLDFEPMLVEPLLPQPTPTGEQLYPTPAREFRLSRLEIEPEKSFGTSLRGPEILFCLRGSLTGSTYDGRKTELLRGHAAFVSAATRSYELHGQGTVFRAAVGAAVPD